MFEQNFEQNNGVVIVGIEDDPVAFVGSDDLLAVVGSIDHPHIRQSLRIARRMQGKVCLDGKQVFSFECVPDSYFDKIVATLEIDKWCPHLCIVLKTGRVLMPRRSWDELQSRGVRSLDELAGNN